MSKGETTVLGVNTSHDTAVAVVVDGEVKHVYEEERSRRAKYWSPRDDSSEGDNGVSYENIHSSLNTRSLYPGTLIFFNASGVNADISFFFC